MLSILLQYLIPLLFTVLTPAVVLLVHKLITALAKKWHLEGVINYDDQVDKLVLQAIQATEKKSINAVGSNAPATPGQQKLADAIKFVNDELNKAGLPQKAADALAMKIESALFDGATLKQAV